MTSSSQGPDRERRKRWWTALGGMVVFVVLGLALVPGLVHRERASPPEPASLGARPENAARVREPNAGAPPIDRSAGVAQQVSGTSPENPAFDCMIGPNKVIEIGSAITGLIETVAVERSDYVEAGQVLARLESTMEEAAVRVARARAQRKVDIEATKASLDLGEKRRKRALELFENDTLSLDLREEVENQATLAALQVEQAWEDHRLASLELEHSVASLARRTIRSPISGFVIERLMDPGEVVDEETILRVAQIDPLRVEVILPSDWFGRVRPGDRAEIVPEAPLDQARAGEVAIVDRVIDGASGTFGARMLLPNPDHDLPAGLRCQVRFLEDSPD